MIRGIGISMRQAHAAVMGNLQLRLMVHRTLARNYYRFGETVSLQARMEAVRLPGRNGGDVTSP